MSAQTPVIWNCKGTQDQRVNWCTAAGCLPKDKLGLAAYILCRNLLQVQIVGLALQIKCLLKSSENGKLSAFAFCGHLLLFFLVPDYFHHPFSPHQDCFPSRYNSRQSPKAPTLLAIVNLELSSVPALVPSHPSERVKIALCFAVEVKCNRDEHN